MHLPSFTVTAVAVLSVTAMLATRDIGWRSWISATTSLGASVLKGANYPKIDINDVSGLQAARDSMDLKSWLGCTIFSAPWHDIRRSDGEINGVGARFYCPSTTCSWEAMDHVVHGRIVIFIHGGGFVVGSIESHDYIAQRVAHETGSLVISVNYRLAPEYPFPAGQTDVVTVLQNVVATYTEQDLHSDQSHSDKDILKLPKILLMGDSAGGNLAITAFLRAHIEEKSLAVRSVSGLLLAYPAVQTNCHECHMSFARFGQGYFLSASMITWFRHLYLGNLGKQIVPVSVEEQFSVNVTSSGHPLISPIEASIQLLSTLPRTAIALAECDPLADEGRAFAAKLEDADVDVHLHVFNRTIHGFVSVPLDQHEEAVAFLIEQAQLMWDRMPA